MLGPLSHIFLAGLAEPARAELAALADLESLLAELVRSARAAWPDVIIPDEQFLPHVANGLPAPSREALAAIRADELYLACACAAGNRGALAAFEARHAGEIDVVCRKMRLAPERAAEVKQLVYEKLFVARDRAPAIAAYSGRGELAGWLRVVATRTALNFVRDQPAELPLDDAMMVALGTPTGDPELELMKRQYGVEFKRAFQEAVEALSARQKTLLRQHFVDGISLEKLGRLHRVHRTTVSRWMGEAQQALLSRTRRALQHLQVSAAELERMMRLIQSQLELSLERVLETSPE